MPKDSTPIPASSRAAPSSPSPPKKGNNKNEPKKSRTVLHGASERQQGVEKVQKAQKEKLRDLPTSAAQARGKTTDPPTSNTVPVPVPAVTPSRQVITTLTDAGTELPMRLNDRVFIDGLPFQDPAGEGKPSILDALTAFAESWKVGKVVRLIKKPGQGFGFLCFRNPNSVEIAVRTLNGRKFMGRVLRVERPKQRQPNASQTRADLAKQNFNRQVLLSDLSKISTPELVTEVIRDCDPSLAECIESVKLVSGGRKAFLTVAAESDVQPVVQLLDGFSLLGRTIHAERALAPGTLPFAKPARVITPSSSSRKRARDEVVSFEEEATTSQQASRVHAPPASLAAGARQKFDYNDQGPAEILVGNLADETTIEDLKKHFQSTCGRVASAELFVNEHTKQPSGIGRVQFFLPAHAQYAKANLDGSVLNGEMLRIDRGDEQSKYVSGNAGTSSGLALPEVDEAAYLRHHGIKNPEAYFAGGGSDEDDSDGENNNNPNNPNNDSKPRPKRKVSAHRRRSAPVRSTANRRAKPQIIGRRPHS